MKELELDTDEFIKEYHLKRLLQLKQEQERRLKLSRLCLNIIAFSSDNAGKTHRTVELNDDTCKSYWHANHMNPLIDP